MSAALHPQDPLRDQKITDIDAFVGPVRLQDVLAFAKTIENKQNGVQKTELTVDDFSQKEIGIGKTVVDHLNDMVRKLGIKVVDNRDGVRVPHAMITMMGAMMHRFIWEGYQAANRGSWFKVGFYTSTIIALVEAIYIIWPK